MSFIYPDAVMYAVTEHYLEAAEYFDNKHIVGIFLQGSQNYHLETALSDVDTKLVVTPTLDEIAYNKAPHSTTHVRANNEHIDFKDVRLMLDTFKKQNLNFLEILFTPYRIINPMYETIWDELVEHREEIAHYNIYFSVKAMKGMACEKYYAMEHNYPSKEEILKQYGYDSKQLHHLLRIKDFLTRYIAGESYEKCMVPKDIEYLKEVKLGKYELLEARAIADKTMKEIEEICEDFTKDSMWNTSNKEVEELLNWAKAEMIKISLKNDLSEEEKHG